MRHFLRLLAAVLLLGASAHASAACAGRLFVSGYFSNNVHVYDACTGEFQRLLDDANRIRGAQATKIGPDGKLWVVSEENARILRYEPDTLAFIDIWTSVGGGFNPTGLAFGPDGDVYVCGYASDTVRRYDATTRQLEATVVPARAGGLDGPDNGMTFGPDGRLYIPGYDANNVVVWDPATNQVATFVARNAGGLVHTRGILFEPGGTVLVSSEGTGQILRYTAGGTFVGVFAGDLALPGGMSFDGDGGLFVATGDSASRVAADGANLGLAFPFGRGGLNGGTFATFVAAAGGSVDASQVGTQYWIVASGVAGAREIVLNDVVSATGTAFGPAFRAQDVVRKRWGSLRIDFTGCRSGT
ncbi:MAG TPA: hypothetical protein VFL14_03695, partial [Xanthomonadales bacterium]|nr:hypothetical protein [Xanthomonadales bacterium]